MSRCCNAPMFGGSYQVEGRGDPGHHDDSVDKKSRMWPVFGGSYQVEDRGRGQSGNSKRSNMSRCCNAPMFGGSYQVEDRGTEGLVTYDKSRKNSRCCNAAMFGGSYQVEDRGVGKSRNTSRCCNAAMFGGSYQVEDRAICVSPEAQGNSQQQQDRAIAAEITGGMNTFSFSDDDTAITCKEYETYHVSHDSSRLLFGEGRFGK